MARPKRSLGQNFLVDENIQRKIVEALGAGPESDVLEIGPGMGALTRHLAGCVRRLVAVELDDALAASLEEEFADTPGVEVVHADILDVDVGALAAEMPDLDVVGNIPYNITTPLIFHFLEAVHRPAELVLMVQKEVADRILAPPGGKSYGALSVGVRAVAEAERLFDVKPGSFRPAPDVESTVLRITPHRPPRLTLPEEDDLRTLTRAAFSRRRKQLQKILRVAPEYEMDADAAAVVMDETGIEFTARPETLAPEDFVRLARALRR